MVSAFLLFSITAGSGTNNHSNEGFIMGKNGKHQVELKGLVFTLSWEDPRSDREALKIQPTDVLLTIISGGCNTLSFLLDNPVKVFAVDINPSQSYILELKIAAMKKLHYAEFSEFLGLSPSKQRVEMYESLSHELTPDARTYWNNNLSVIGHGILGRGKYESFIAVFRKILNLMQGKKRIEGLFESKTLEQQQTYFDEVWNTRRWRAIFRVFFNKKILARRGLSAEYFHFDDGSASFADSFFRRSRRAMRDLPIKDNYFLSQYLLGRYLSDDDLPDYLRKKNFDLIRNRLDRITIITADAKQWLSEQSSDIIDCFSLSNICELMSLEDTAKTFTEVFRTARKEARMCFRNLMIPRTVPDNLKESIYRDTELSTRLLQSDRSFVYSRVDALFVKKT
jgi:S-adenosylmethionine-diacylglycerol 3-amino-3-carboxypropyl transferase